jgi:hypothetical protein
MKLLRAVAKIEERLAADLAGQGCEVGLVWTCDEVIVDRVLETGEFLARDMHELDPAGEGLTHRVLVVERVTRDANDLGWVYDAADVEVGRVVEMDGSLISYCRHEAAPGAVPAVEASAVPEAVIAPEAAGAAVELPAAVAAVPRAVGGRAGEPQAAECEPASAEPPRGRRASRARPALRAGGGRRGKKTGL